MAECECGPWYAVHDHQGPPTLRVQGTCTVSMTGTTVKLQKHQPPGIDPTDLLLDLVYTPPDVGLPKIEDVPVHFEELTDNEYETVSIIDCQLGIEVHDVH